MQNPDETPEGEEREETAEARAALKAGNVAPGSGADSGEKALEDGMDALTPGLQPHMEAMLAPLFAAVADGLAPEELMSRLSSLYPDLDANALQEHMARVFFVSDLWGRLRAQAEAEAEADNKIENKGGAA